MSTEDIRRRSTEVKGNAEIPKDVLPGSNTNFFKIESEDPESIQNNALDTVATQSTSFCTSIGYFKIEVVLFLYMFSFMMRAVSSVSMLMDKACIVHLGYSEEICNNLSAHQQMKNEVEKLANNYFMGYNLIQIALSSVLVCFIGSWSDKYSRKLPLIISFLGIILDGLGATICASLFHSRIEFYLICAIFTGLSGGIIGTQSVMYSYASDTTTFSERTMKYAIMDMTMVLSMPLGSLAGGWMYKFYGYTSVFLTSTIGHLFALVWVMFVIKETRGLDNKESWGVKFRNLWSIQQIVDSFKAAVKQRPNRGKEQILCIIVAMGFASLFVATTPGIGFLYVHQRLDWDNTYYSTVSAIFSILGIVVMMICVKLFKYFNVGDPTLGLVGGISSLLRNVGVGLASSEGVYFLANSVGLFSDLCALAGRSRISKVTSKNDIGKIFALLAISGTVLSTLITAVVSQVFNATLDFFPGLVYLVLGILTMIPVGVFIWLASLPKFDFEEMCDDSETKEEVEKYSNANSSEETN